MKRIFLSATFAALFSFPSHAIITRHDIPDSNYVVKDSDYPALVDLNPNDCIGTLVHESYLLTVAHCTDESLGDTLKINGVSHRIDKVVRHPKWRDDQDKYDIALIRFEVPVEGVKPLPIYRNKDELGLIITMFGRGSHATGLQGEKGSSVDGSLRKARNIVSAVNDHFFEIFFDRPGDKDILDLEGVGAAGDSGGPVFIEVGGMSYIAGLNSWGKGSGSIGIGQYGSVDYQTRVSQYLDWLDSEVDLP